MLTCPYGLFLVWLPCICLITCSLWSLSCFFVTVRLVTSSLVIITELAREVTLTKSCFLVCLFVREVVVT